MIFVAYSSLSEEVVSLVNFMSKPAGTEPKCEALDEKFVVMRIENVRNTA